MNTLPIIINDEYCWMHDFPGGGGWSCMHPDCISREAVLQIEKQVVAELKSAGYNMKHVGRSYICESPTGFVYEIRYVDQLMDQLLFAKAPLPLELLNSDVISDILAKIMPEVEAERIWEEVPVTEKRRAIDATSA